MSIWIVNSKVNHAGRSRPLAITAKTKAHWVLFAGFSVTRDPDTMMSFIDGGFQRVVDPFFSWPKVP